jgi:bifunctional non-homologous end joining protein LigD
MTAQQNRTAAPVTIDGRQLSLSNLDKVLYPESGFTKRQVIEYYTAIAPYLLPHLKDRPITMKRFPDGVAGAYFYEKDAPSFTPKWMETFAIPRSSVTAIVNYTLINDLPSLIWSANLANLELHPFLAKAPHIERPTMVVFDLDPGDGMNILRAGEVAFFLKELLERLNLKCFVKVSGSKGLHLHVPLNANVTYEATQPFANSVAQLLASENPGLVVSEMAKAKRRGKIFVDWSQNSEHKSTVAVYSLRARNDGPFVAMPVTWGELRKAMDKSDLKALFFRPDEAIRRVKKRGDLFAPLLKLRQELPESFLNLMQPAGGSETLDLYRRKRDFTKTPEPAPTAAPDSSRRNGGKLFVIQKHAATRLHYDFRLEMGGTLKSWAVPKGPPYDRSERRLAMATEDHPMAYADFEGVIPKGEYGGGTVMVWDTGTYELMDGDYWKGKLHFRLNGTKLQGEWILVKGHDRNGKDKDNVWYMIKGGEPMARPTERTDDSSALTGRSMAEIAGARDAVWHSNRDADTQLRPSSLPSAKVRFIEPMLARAAAALPENRDEWTYEVKLDGYRCLAGKQGRDVKLWSRRGNVITGQFREIADACAALPPDTLLDGEIVALDENGRVSFNLLQHHRAKASALRFYAFDALIVGGRSLLQLPLEQRRTALLDALPADAGASAALAASESLDAPAAELTRVIREFGLEGVVAKRRDSRYEPGKRSGTWLKYKINKSQEFVIGGYTVGHPFDALVVGCYEGEELLYVGKVRNGFVSSLRREVMKQLKPLETEVCPFANLPEKKRTPWALTKEGMKNCIWLKPERVAQCEFTEWTPDGHLRQLSFLGMRDDKKARDVVREH